MKKDILICSLVLSVVLCISIASVASTNYVFQVDKTSKLLRASYKTTETLSTNNGSLARVFVTFDQYTNGFSNLSPAIVNKAISDAKKELSDPDNQEDDYIKAISKTMRFLHNALRTNNAATNLTALTKEEFNQLVNDNM